MGKPKPLGPKKRRRAARRMKATRDDPENLSVKELLKAAQEEMDNFQYQAAQKFCHIALQKEPDNVSALETSASLCLELGNLDGARHCLGRAITMQPESGHEKYMSMAQLMDGRDALQCYQKGIEILTKKISSLPPTTTENDGEVQMTTEEGTQGGKNEGITVKDKPMEPTQDEGNENISPAEAEAGGSGPSTSSLFLSPQQQEKARLVRQVSTAHCSVAELFMTDLCDEEEAEETCRATIMKAIELDSSNPETYQLMASFLLVKQEVEEAKKYITKSLEMWLPQYLTVGEDNVSTRKVDGMEVCPLSYSSRVNTARILIEVEEHKTAYTVLDGLLEEDDTVVDVWYLMGWSCYLRGEDEHDEAQYCIYRALEAHEETPCEDTQMVEHMKELREELGHYIWEEESNEDIEGELESDSEEEDTMDMS